MSGFAEREKSRKKGVVASMISEDNTQQENVGRGRPKEQRETKKRISLAVLPSVYEDMQKIAYVDRMSMSEIVSDFMEKYVQENASKIEEYDKMKK